MGIDSSKREERIEKIRQLVESFGRKYLDEELVGYANRLCDRLSDQDTLSLDRGDFKNWAASIVYVIARLNFLFDPDNPLYLKADTLCGFFGVKKSTVSAKANRIEDACQLSIGDEYFCRPEIVDAFTLITTPEGFVFPKRMLDERELVIKFADEEESERIRAALAERERLREIEIAEEKAYREEERRRIAQEKHKKQFENQLNLFDEL